MPGDALGATERRVSEGGSEAGVWIREFNNGTSGRHLQNSIDAYGGHLRKYKNF